MKELFKVIGSKEVRGKDAVLATVLDPEKHAKALIVEGEIIWSKGDIAVIEKNLAEVKSIEKTGSLTLDGEEIFAEKVKGEPNLIVCGAGHVGIACIKLAKVLDTDVTIIEDREDFAQLALEAGADRAIVKPFQEGLAEAEYDEGTFYLCMTRAHAFDQDCLEVILPRESAYVGMLGSARKINALKANLEEKGIDGSLFDKLHSPVGLDISAKTPAEIAVSVMAEIVQVKNTSENIDRTFTHEILDCVMSEEAPAMLCTLVSNNGGTPRTPGTKMLVYAQDDSVGTIGGGVMEADTRRKAAKMLEDPSIEAAYIHIGIDENEATSGMSCCGSAYVLVERIG